MKHKYLCYNHTIAWRKNTIKIRPPPSSCMRNQVNRLFPYQRDYIYITNVSYTFSYFIVQYAWANFFGHHIIRRSIHITRTSLFGLRNAILNIKKKLKYLRKTLMRSISLRVQLLTDDMNVISNEGVVILSEPLSLFSCHPPYPCFTYLFAETWSMSNIVIYIMSDITTNTEEM